MATKDYKRPKIAEDNCVYAHASAGHHIAFACSRGPTNAWTSCVCAARVRVRMRACVCASERPSERARVCVRACVYDNFDNHTYAYAIAYMLS